MPCLSVTTGARWRPTAPLRWAHDLWRRCVVLSVPPLPVFGQVAFTYAQIKRSFYFWFFQMKISPSVVAANDLAFIDGIWADWSPGYDGREDLGHVKRCLGNMSNLKAAMGYYRCNVAPDSFGIVSEAPPPMTRPILSARRQRRLHFDFRGTCPVRHRMGWAGIEGGHRSRRRPLPHGGEA